MIGLGMPRIGVPGAPGIDAMMPLTMTKSSGTKSSRIKSSRIKASRVKA